MISNITVPPATVKEPDLNVSTEKKEVNNLLSDEPIIKNKNNKIFTALIVGVIILILIGASYLSKSILNRQNNKTEDRSEFSVNGFTCYDLDNYFVITRLDLSGNPGDDILVKYKKDQEQDRGQINCDYKVEDNDLEILNTPLNTVTYYQYFSSINNDLLIIDEGAESNKSFRIYDLVKRQKVFGDTYSLGLFDLQNNTLTYWHKTNDIPNKSNCSKIDEYNLKGGARIESKMSLNLLDLTERKYGEFRCSSID